jgi:hypothetical protein
MTHHDDTWIRTGALLAGLGVTASAQHAPQPWEPHRRLGIGLGDLRAPRLGRHSTHLRWGRRRNRNVHMAEHHGPLQGIGSKISAVAADRHGVAHRLQLNAGKYASGVAPELTHRLLVLPFDLRCCSRNLPLRQRQDVHGRRCEVQVVLRHRRAKDEIRSGAASVRLESPDPVLKKVHAPKAFAVGLAQLESFLPLPPHILINDEEAIKVKERAVDEPARSGLAIAHVVIERRELESEHAARGPQLRWTADVREDLSVFREVGQVSTSLRRKVFAAAGTEPFELHCQVQRLLPGQLEQSTPVVLIVPRAFDCCSQGPLVSVQASPEPMPFTRPMRHAERLALTATSFAFLNRRRPQRAQRIAP